MYHTDLKVAETEKVNKEKEAKLEKTIEIHRKEEKKAKAEIKSFKKTHEKPKGNCCMMQLLNNRFIDKDILKQKTERQGGTFRFSVAFKPSSGKYIGDQETTAFQTCVSKIFPEFNATAIFFETSCIHR